MAGPQVQVRHDRQQLAQAIEVAGLPGLGQGGGAGLPGGGQVPGIGEQFAQHEPALPGGLGRDVRDLPGLPGQPHRLVQVAG
jgi:hypothetical protein